MSHSATKSCHSSVSARTSFRDYNPIERHLLSGHKAVITGRVVTAVQYAGRARTLFGTALQLPVGHFILAAHFHAPKRGSDSAESGSSQTKVDEAFLVEKAEFTVKTAFPWPGAWLRLFN